ncbi:MAG: Stp1/IreP family PP2C-type Ser/Thr phosphatase [Anaerotardibacter sp.]
MTNTNLKLSSSGAFFGGCTDVGRVREHNEDSMLLAAPLFAVADGMGGHEAGEVASEIAIQTLAEMTPEHLDAIGLEQAVVAANLNVMRAPAQGVGRDGMGTTLTAAMVENERLLVAQVGDSRAYLLHGGHMQQITRDHSLMADMIESGQITEEEARFHPNRSVITRAIGSDAYMRPDIYELNVVAGDRLLLCSDGLNTMLEDREIRYILSSVSNPQKCCEELVEAALRAGGHDNVTVVVVDVQGFTQVKRKKQQRKSRMSVVFVALLVVLILAASAFGAYAYVNNSAYLIAENGKVSVYRGIQDSFLGISLSSLDRTTDVEVDKLPAGVAQRITKGMAVDGIEAANSLIEEYELTIAEESQKAKDSTIEAVPHTDNQDASQENGGA